MTRSARPDKDGERGPAGCSAQSSAGTASRASATLTPPPKRIQPRSVHLLRGSESVDSCQGWRGSSSTLGPLAAATHQAPGSVHGVGAVSVCRIAFRVARMRLAEVSRFRWNRPFARASPQMCVKPKEVERLRPAAPARERRLGRKAAELQHARLLRRSTSTQTSRIAPSGLQGNARRRPCARSQRRCRRHSARRSRRPWRMSARHCCSHRSKT